MPVRIRLQRHGKKGKPFYWIVAADSRAKRDGRYLEKLGIYNPNTNPATVELNLDQSVKWLENGAQPSDTARTLLSYRGVMLKHHLNGGVKKGAFSQEEADKRLEAWLEEKQAKIQAKIDGLDKDMASELASRLAAEKAVNQKRIDAMNAVPEAEETAETTAEGETPEASEATAETTTEEVAPVGTEVVQDETPEEDTTEAAISEEAPAEEVPTTEAAAEEMPAEEVPATDAAAEEMPAEEAPAADAPVENTEEEESKE